MQNTENKPTKKRSSINLDEHAETGINKKSGEFLARLSKPSQFSKGDSRYWLQPGRLFKNRGSSTFSIRLSRAGDRESFGLGTANKSVAASKAVEIYDYLTREGMAATRARFNPKAAKKADLASVGEWLHAVQENCIVRSSTLQTYAESLRKLAGDIAKSPKAKSRYSSQEWRQVVHQVPLSMLDSSRVNKWQVAYRKGKPSDPETQRQALNSARAIVRNGKALFGAKITKALRDVAGLSLPDPLPMADVNLTEIFGRKQRTRYQSKINAGELIAMASTELAHSEPEAFKTFLLALCCGLRKRELDTLLWSQVDLEAGTIRIENTEHVALKSEDSAGEVDLDPELLALLRGWRSSAKGRFVIDGGDQTEFKNRQRYRCDRVFKVLIPWLRQHGVEATKALHELRKEAGCLVAQSAGIYAASRLLRHGSIQITADSYLDKKQRISTGLGSLLPASNVIAFEPEAPKKQPKKARA